MSVRIALLARFPRLRVQVYTWPIIPEEERSRYPELEADFALLDEVVVPAFEKYDREALRDLNSYRRQQVVLIGEATVVAVLGGLLVFLSDQRWPAVLLALLGVLFAVGTIFPGDGVSEAAAMSARLKAERLRSLYFVYLSGTGRYAGGDSVAALGRAVLAIEAGREPE
jgi:hypothetical protein